MKELIELIVRSLVDDPGQISVTEVGGNHTSILELRVAETDTGKVIGRQGRTATAIRTILTAAAAKQRRRAVLEIID